MTRDMLVIRRGPSGKKRPDFPPREGYEPIERAAPQSEEADARCRDRRDAAQQDWPLVGGASLSDLPQTMGSIAVLPVSVVGAIDVVMTPRHDDDMPTRRDIGI
jgi:hypothetical protein